MHRLACVLIPDFALQVVQARKPEWRSGPLAVVDGDGPQARIVSVNAPARALGTVSGMRYAQALGLVPRLHACPLSAGDCERAVEALMGFLRAQAPEVEPSAGEHGVFFVNVSGLEGMYGSFERWAETVREGLASRGFHAAVVVGFSRFGTYAAAVSSLDVRVFTAPRDETDAALRVPLHRLNLPDKPGHLLSTLGVDTVADFLRLPRAALRGRFGDDVHRLHMFAAGEMWIPLRPSFDREAPRVAIALEAPEASSEALLFLIKRAFPRLASMLAARGETMAALTVHLKIEGEPHWRRADIRPAAPTLDEGQIVDLVRLRLERLRLGGRVTDLALDARGIPGTVDAPVLLAERPRRDLAAGGRALARLRAALGEGAVVRARPRDGHLPEARFTWEPAKELVPPRPRGDVPLNLVRRIWGRPVPLWRTPQEAPAAGGLVNGSREPAGGPYIVSGGWWVKPVHREYFFVETPRHEILWIYFDRIRQVWFAHGRVE